MPAIQRSEFALALNQVASERGVDVEVVLETVRNAILAAYRKDHPGAEIEEFTAELDPNSGEAHILKEGKDVTPPGFGRIAAQTAKQVILQKIREKEKEAILTDFRDKVGTVINGMVLRFAGPNVIVDVGKTEALMPPGEQMPQEKYHLNQRLSFYMLEIRDGMKGEEIIVSRSSNGLVEGLFKREVPEIAQGSVEVKQIVREPGNRTKIAVFSTQPGIDPVGSCVGQKGVRVQAIIQELGGIEKVDIIQWSDDIKTYIAQALSPAKNVTLEIDEKEKVAHAKVPQEELSLAIGKDGQNVRLAHKLTGYRIEIEGIGEPPAPVEEKVEKVEEVVEAEEKPAEEVSVDSKDDAAASSEPVVEVSDDSSDEKKPEAEAEAVGNPDEKQADSSQAQEVTIEEAEEKESAESDESPADEKSKTPTKETANAVEDEDSKDSEARDTNSENEKPSEDSSKE